MGILTGLYHTALWIPPKLTEWHAWAGIGTQNPPRIPFHWSSAIPFDSCASFFHCCQALMKPPAAQRHRIVRVNRSVDWHSNNVWGETSWWRPTGKVTDNKLISCDSCFLNPSPRYITYLDRITQTHPPTANLALPSTSCCWVTHGSEVAWDGDGISFGVKATQEPEQYHI